MPGWPPRISDSSRRRRDCWWRWQGSRSSRGLRRSVASGTRPILLGAARLLEARAAPGSRIFALARRLFAANLVNRVPQDLQHAFLFLDGGVQLFINRGLQLVAQAEKFSLHLLPLAASATAGAATEVVRDILVLSILPLPVREIATDQGQPIPDLIGHTAVTHEVPGARRSDAVKLLRPL